MLFPELDFIFLDEQQFKVFSHSDNCIQFTAAVKLMNRLDQS